MSYLDAVMTDEEAAVWQVLATCRGRSMAILGPEVAELTGIGYKRCQKIISDLVCHHAKPIGSSTRGYYITITADEDEAVSHYVRHRAIVALHRESQRRKTSLIEIFKQAVFEFWSGRADAGDCERCRELGTTAAGCEVCGGME